MGKFYEIFYHDAVIVQKHCRLKWMHHDSKPHVGFPETSLYNNAKRLVDLGFRVSVVEQMETPKELEKRNKLIKGPKDKAVKREVCEVMTKGTLTQTSMLMVDRSFLGVFEQFDTEDACYLCAVLVDCSSCLCFVEALKVPLNDFQSMLIAMRDLHAKYSIKEAYVRPSFPSFLVSGVPLPIEVHEFSFDMSDKIVRTIKCRYQSDFNSNGFDEVWKSPAVEAAFEQLCGCLNNVMILEGFLGACEIKLGHVWENNSYIPLAFENDSQHKNSCLMKIGSNAVLQLALKEESSSSSEASLISFLDHTATPMGKRLLREWILNPLVKSEHIKRRFKVVELARMIQKRSFDLKTDQLNTLLLKGVKDLERIYARICSSGQQTKRSAVYFDNHPFKKIEELIDFFEVIEQQCFKLINIFNIVADQITSGNLGTTPDIVHMWIENRDHISRIQSSFTQCRDQLHRESVAMTGSQVGLNVQECWLPKPGLFEAFDQQRDTYYELVRNIENECVSLSKELNMNLRFVHAKYKYEIEVSNADVNKPIFKKAKKDHSWGVTSQRAGFTRFRTADIEKYVDELDETAQNMSDNLYPVIRALVEVIIRYQTDFKYVINIIAEWDCFLSLAYASDKLANDINLPICEPQIAADPSRPFLEVKDLYHPILSDALSKKEKRFIPSDIKMGHENRIIVLTGPNMGGKSTLLRSVAMMIILAQIGSYVPASSMCYSPFSSIYTRIGARDAILEGKSTFLVELEELSLAINSELNASQYPSIALIDELGRGTSTFDGTAIALATLRMISDGIPQMLTFFSTHYHVIPDMVRNGQISHTVNNHMSISMDDKENATVKYGYKLTKGPSDNSLGIEIAKVAGLPDSVVERASVISGDMGRTMESILNDKRLEAMN